MSSSKVSVSRPAAWTSAPAPALRPGSCLAVIAPSSPFDRDAFERGVTRLQRRYDVRYERGIYTRHGFLAGGDARRLRELETALDDPTVDAIVAARGGYGTTRLLDALDPAQVERANKLLVGFSDVTGLHALWARAGVRSIHGPMVATLGTAPEAHLERWVGAVEGAMPDPIARLERIRGGRAKGALVGGNLAVLAALAGTPYVPPLEDAVLFLEDVGERPYRVDRMLTQLWQAGWLSRVAAVVLGAFARSTPGPDDVPIHEVLAERLQDVAGPVLAGLPAGHLDDNLELPLGAPVCVDGDACTLVFEEPAVAR